MPFHPPTAPKLRAKKLIIFDCDGVLINSVTHLNKHMAHFVMQHYGLTLSQAQELCWQGYQQAGCSGVYLAERDDHSPQWVEDMYASMTENFLKEIHRHAQPCGVFISQLAELRNRGYTLAMLTAGHKHHGQSIAEFLEIADHFHLILGRDCVGSLSKRTPTPYLKLLDRFETWPPEIHMLEDSPANLNAAHRLGMRTTLIGDKPPANWMHHHAPNVKTWLGQLLSGQLQPHTYINGVDVGQTAHHSTAGC